MKRTVCRSWINVVFLLSAPISVAGLTSTMASTKYEATTLINKAKSTGVGEQTDSSSSVSTTLSLPIFLRTGEWTFPPVIHTIAPVIRTLPPPTQIIPEIQTMARNTPSNPHIVLQGLVVTMPKLLTISPIITRKNETANMNGSNNEKEQKLIVNQNSLVYGNKGFADSVYNYVFPTVLGMCLLTTLIFMLILGKRFFGNSSKMSKASCLLLIAVAVADVLTMASALAEIGWLFSQTDSNNMFLPPGSCRIMLILERISAIPHAASTWFTVILAVQRYMCVSKPFSAGRHIQIKSSCIYILTVTALMIALHSCRFFDKTFITIYVQVSVPLRNETTSTCQGNYADWVKNPDMYESVFAWLRIALTQFIPCIFIVCFVFLMIKALRKTTQITIRMKLDDSKMYSDRRQLSLFVIIVAIIVFCVEMSSGIFLSFSAWGLSTGQIIFSYKSLKTASIALDLILYVSYFVIFLLYCLMSKEFRRAIMSLCCDRKCATKRKQILTDSASLKKTTASTPLTTMELKITS